MVFTVPLRGGTLQRTIVAEGHLLLMSRIKVSWWAKILFESCFVASFPANCKTIYLWFIPGFNMCGTRLCMVGMSAPWYIKVVALMPIECSLVTGPPQIHLLVGYSNDKHTPVGYYLFILSHFLWVIFVNFSYSATLLGSFLWIFDTSVGVKIHPADTPVGVEIHPADPSPLPISGRSAPRGYSHRFATIGFRSISSDGSNLHDRNTLSLRLLMARSCVSLWQNLLLRFRVAQPGPWCRNMAMGLWLGRYVTVVRRSIT